MTNTKLYTAVGKFKTKRSGHGLRFPLVTVGGEERILDVQEMILWTILNWRILSMAEAAVLYGKKASETGFTARRSMEECMRRLIQRGLVAEGTGDSGADALYDLLSELYIIPISESVFLKLLSFIRLTVFSRIPYSVTRKIFSRDKRSGDEQKVMRLANQVVLSTAEIVKCFEQDDLSLASEEDLLDALYHDEYTTSENIAYMVRCLPQCRTVITSVANLYLRKQIIFERN